MTTLHSFLVALALAPLAAAADDMPAQPLPDLVVTATRTEQPALDLPASIDRIDLDGNGVDGPGVQLAEILAASAGVLARSRQNFAQDEQISIRGFGARSTFGVRGVRLYTDGIPATMPDGQGQTAHFDLDGAERIEVLRGPFSALYGNAAGGVIQLFTADGADHPGWETRFSGGSFGTSRTAAALRGGNERGSWAVDAGWLHSDGFRDHSDADRYKAAAKLRLQIGAASRVTLLLNSFQQPLALDPQGLTRAQYEADPRQAAPGALTFNTRKSVRQNQAGAIFEQALGAHQSWQLLGYYGGRHIEQFLSVPTSSQASPLSSGGVVDLDGRYGGADARWSLHRDLAGRPFELVAGISADRLDQARLGYENFVGSQVGVRGALRRDEDDRVDDLDEYLQGAWHFAPAWSLRAGVRHSKVRFDFQDHYITADNPDDSGARSYSATNPVAGLTFFAAPGWRLYTAYGHGFETPTLNELAYRDDGSVGLNSALQAARSHNVEAGSKLNLPGGGRLDAAVFLTRTRDEIAVRSSDGGRTVFQNLGNTRRRGVELTFDQPFLQSWDAKLAYTGLDATFGGDARLPGVPRNNLYSGLSWSHAGWSAGLNLRALSHVVTNDANSLRAAGYALLGASASRTLRFGGHALRLFVSADNLLDRRYVGSVIVNEANGRAFEPGPSLGAFAGVVIDGPAI